ncbi:uncharacterized protein LOC143289009 [Babylonia areolata]|uniref:uncharacterized protein LOC143289009 n=1 Tax=Babylonia areolata TaxID=304850 RepID=UPI003FD2AAE3
MATSADIKYNVPVGVNEYDDKKVILMYTIPDPPDRIDWNWITEQSEDGQTTHVAHMVARDSNRGHKSKPIPDQDFQKLGSKISKSRSSIYYRVKIPRKDKVSIEKYFKAS